MLTYYRPCSAQYVNVTSAVMYPTFTAMMGSPCSPIKVLDLELSAALLADHSNAGCVLDNGELDTTFEAGYYLGADHHSHRSEL